MVSWGSVTRLYRAFISLGGVLVANGSPWCETRFLAGVLEFQTTDLRSFG